jgi:hypothetical protein
MSSIRVITGHSHVLESREEVLFKDCLPKWAALFDRHAHGDDSNPAQQRTLARVPGDLWPRLVRAYQQMNAHQLADIIEHH